MRRVDITNLGNRATVYAMRIVRELLVLPPPPTGEPGEVVVERTIQVDASLDPLELVKAVAEAFGSGYLAAVDDVNEDETRASIVRARPVMHRATHIARRQKRRK